MSLAGLPPLNLVTGALLLFALCAGFVLLRGIGRMLLGTLVLGASAWLAFLAWQHAPAWTIGVLGKPNKLISTGLPVIVFIAAMVFIRGFIKFIVSPFVRPGDRSPPPFTNVPLRLVFAIIAAAVLWLLGATFVHHAGSIAEIRSMVEKSATAGATSAYLMRMKSAVEKALPGSWLKLLDPLAEPGRLALAKLIAVQSDASLPQVIDPATGKPYPRAIIVDDPALQGLARQKDFSTLMRHPKLTQAMKDPKVKKALADRTPTP
jgi:hypothetical protein